jgi:hypothetical protein
MSDPEDATLVGAKRFLKKTGLTVMKLNGLVTATIERQQNHIRIFIFSIVKLKVNL